MTKWKNTQFKLTAILYCVSGSTREVIWSQQIWGTTGLPHKVVLRGRGEHNKEYLKEELLA